MSTFNKYRTKGAFHWDWYQTEDWYKYLVDRAVKFCKGDTIDVGCGDGLFLAKHYKQYGFVANEGLDNDIDGITIALKKANGATYQLGDVNNYKPHKFDTKHEYLACINSIEHFDKPEVIKEMIANCITKGAIITTIDYQGGALGEDHKFEWTYDEMMDFFKEFNPKGFRYKDTEWIGVEIIK